MTNDRSKSRRRLVGTLTVLLIGVAAAGPLLHRMVVRRIVRSDRIQDAEMRGRLIGALWSDPDPANRDAYNAYGTFCTRVASMPNVAAARIWNADGSPLASSAARPSDLTALTAAPDETGSHVAVHPPIEPTGPYRLDITLRSDYPSQDPAPVMSLMLRPPDGQGSASPIDEMTIGFVGFCALAAAAGGWTLRREALGPLANLLDDATTTRGVPSHSNLARRTDEWGVLARRMAELCNDADRLRSHAEHVERRMESRLAEKTREIMQDLHRAQREAWQDPLTGVHNRRLLEDKLPLLVAAQQSAQQELALAMLDLDHFKRLNDTAGHHAGDAVLRFVGELLHQCVRDSDLPVRYGGDEFVLVFPGMNVEEAAARVRRISAMFAQQAKIMVGSDLSPTLTAGVAGLRHNRAASPNALLALADRALYEAKKAGRGTVRVCPESWPTVMPSHPGPVGSTCASSSL